MTWNGEAKIGGQHGQHGNIPRHLDPQHQHGRRKNKIKQADTQDGKTTKAAIGNVNFGNQNNFKEMIYRLWF